MYRAHCQRILDAIVRANFEELNTLVFHFWQKIPHHLAPVLSSLLLINLLGICDIRLYRTIIKLISVTLGQPLTDLYALKCIEIVAKYNFYLTYQCLHSTGKLCLQSGLCPGNCIAQGERPFAESEARVGSSLWWHCQMPTATQSSVPFSAGTEQQCQLSNGSQATLPRLELSRSVCSL